MRIRQPRVKRPRIVNPRKHKRGKQPRPNFTLTSDAFLSKQYGRWKPYYLPVAEERLQTFRTGFAQMRQFGGPLNGYRQLIKEGKPATTAAQGLKSRQLSLGWYDWSFGWWGEPAGQYNEGRMSGNYAEGIIPSIGAFSDPDLENEALSQFIRKARKAQASAMTGEFMHDLGKTLGSFNRTRDIFLRSFGRVVRKQLWIAKSTSLRTQFLGIRHARNRNRRDALGRLSDNWLEWNYGIAPTVSDLEDQSFAIWRAYDRSVYGVDSKHVKGWAQSQTNSSTNTGNLSLNTPNGSSKPRIYYADSMTDTKYVAFYGAVRTLRSDSFVENLQQDLGLGLRSFVPTLWELVPYSFIVDQFTNIGQIIDALVFPRSDVLWVNKLLRREATGTRSFRTGFAIPLNPGTLITHDEFSTSPAAFSQTFFSRILFTGSLVPSFRWHLPFRGTDWLSDLALIGSRLAKR